MDQADMAQINEERERQLALERVLNVDLGVRAEHNGQRCCVDCGEPIDAARLAAWPGAVRCADCQASIELRHKATYGH